MSVFGYEKFLRSVSRNGQEFILFSNLTKREDFIAVSPVGTLRKAKMKRASIAVFKKLSYILAAIVVLASVSLGFVFSSFWFFALLIVVVLLVVEWIHATEEGKTTSEAIFGRRCERYFTETVLIIGAQSTRDLFVDYMLNASDEEFLNTAEKMARNSEIKRAILELESKIRHSRRDSEIVELAQIKLKALRKKEKASDSEIFSFIHNLKVESEDKSLFESVFKAEKLLAG